MVKEMKMKTILYVYLQNAMQFWFIHDFGYKENLFDDTFCPK